MRRSRSTFRTVIRALPLAVVMTTWPALDLRAQNSPEEFLLTVARAKELARGALDDLVLPIGTLLVQIGPSSVYAGGGQGPGRLSVALGGAGGPLTIQSPDYTEPDPTGTDQIEAGVGAAYADVSIGLVPGSSGPRVEGVGSVDLLLRLGYTLGDQPDIGDEVDLGSLKPIYGIGTRVGILKGPGLPAISLAAGVNVFQKRTFGVQDTEDGTPFEVRLDLEQTTKFALLEIAKKAGFFTPYLAVGIADHGLDAEYVSEVVYDAPAKAIVTDIVESDKSRGVFFGGLEIGGGLVRFTLQGGFSGGEPFGNVFLRLTR